MLSLQYHMMLVGQVLCAVEELFLVLNSLRVHSYRMSIVMEGESFVDICLVRGVMMVRV